METPQGGEYPRTPYNHSIRAECEKLEYMVFSQWSDIIQKKKIKSVFCSVERSGTLQKARPFPALFPHKHIFIIQKS